MADFFTIQTVQSVHVIELSLPDSIDVLEFDRLNELMLGQLDGKAAESWVLDLSGVDYLGSAMLGLFINIRQQVKSAGGRLVLCGISSRLSEIIRTCSMDRLFTIRKTRNDSIAALKSSTS